MSRTKVIYDESICVRCGEIYTLDKMIWSDSEMGHVCKSCANLPVGDR